MNTKQSLPDLRCYKVLLRSWEIIFFLHTFGWIFDYRNCFYAAVI